MFQLLARLKLRIYETLRLFKNGFMRKSSYGVFQNLVKIWQWDLKSVGPGQKGPSQQMKVIYLLEEFVVTGGVFSVVQLVNELNKLGVNARIAFLYRSYESLSWNLTTKPMFYSSWNHLLREIPECDVVVSTYWTTATWAQRLVLAQKAKTSVYYLQDYEAWFYKESQKKIRQSVYDSYGLIENRILKSKWLQHKLAVLGYTSSIVPMGLDLDIFKSAPRRPMKGQKIRVLAMARPETPRRGYSVLIESIARALQLGAPIEVTLFGSNQLATKEIPFRFTDKGVVNQMESLAEIYRAHDIFIECSHFQGFGRISLEAMASGCACILTSRGGVNAYAIDEHNCILAEPGDTAFISNAIFQLANDHLMRSRLSEHAIQAASKFDKAIEAEMTYKLFQDWVAKVLPLSSSSV